MQRRPFETLRSQKQVRRAWRAVVGPPVRSCLPARTWARASARHGSSAGRTGSPGARTSCLAALGLVCLLALATAVFAGDPPGAVRRLLADPDPSARAAAVRRLSGEAQPAAVDLVIETLDDPHPYVRRAAAGVLGVLLPAPARHRARVRVRRSRSERVRASAASAFVLWADAEGREGLEQILEDRDPEVRRAGLEALEDVATAGEAAAEPGVLCADPALVARVARCLADSDGRVRAEALAWLDRFGGVSETELGPLRSDPYGDVRLAALESSVARGGATAMVAVLHGLSDAVWSVRIRAAELSVQVPEREVVEALVSRLADARTRVAQAALQSLVALTGVPFEPDVERWQAWLSGDGRDFDPGGGPLATPQAHDARTVEGPRFLGVPIVSRHVAFVVDTSSSMAERGPDGRTRFAVVQAELSALLDGLVGARAVVNVILFASRVEPLLERARMLSRGTQGELDAALARVVPAGRTALYDGLAAALSDSEVDQVVLLSDGAPSAGDWFTRTDLIAEVGRRNRFRRARIDVIAVGSDRIGKRWRGALEQIAVQAGGIFLAR